jgi:hypothetical protein
MAVTKPIKYHRRATMALSAFSPAEQRKVKEALHAIQEPAAPDVAKPIVSRIDPFESTYLLRATPKIRVIFRESEDGIEVEDVVLRDTLESFHRMVQASGPPSKAEERRPASNQEPADPHRSKEPVDRKTRKPGKL